MNRFAICFRHLLATFNLSYNPVTGGLFLRANAGIDDAPHHNTSIELTFLPPRDSLITVSVLRARVTAT